MWSGLPFPSPGDLPDPGIEPTSPALAGRFSATVPPGKPSLRVTGSLKNPVVATQAAKPRGLKASGTTVSICFNSDLCFVDSIWDSLC